MSVPELPQFIKRYAPNNQAGRLIAELRLGVRVNESGREGVVCDHVVAWLPLVNL